MPRVRSNTTVYLPSGAIARKGEISNVTDSDVRLMIRCKMEFNLLEDEVIEDIKVEPIKAKKKKKNVSDNNA